MQKLTTTLFPALIGLLFTLGGCVVYDDGYYDDPPYPSGSASYSYCDDHGCYECDDYGCWSVGSGGTDGLPCATDEECMGGCYCTDGGVCASVGFCAIDADCPADFKCDERDTCVPVNHGEGGGPTAPGGGGTGEPTDPECPDEPPAGAECACASDCALGQYCQNGACLGDPIVGPGDSCTYDGECGGGTCVDNRCHSPCTTSNDCGTGDICQAGYCYPDPTPTVECVFNIDCAPSQTCINAQCHDNCIVDDDCDNAADFCDQGVCQPDWTRVSECVFNSDCDPSEECTDGQCRTRCGTHQDCATCVDGPNCVGGYCQ